jgi:protein-disulfide isomerase
MKNKPLIYIGSGLLLVIIFIMASMFYKNSQEEKYSFLASEYNEVFVRNHSPRYGNENAKVYLTEFLDPECESCRAFYPKVKNLLKEFEGKVQLIIRYAPLHHNSTIAINAIEAARLQGKYWEALALLFEHQPSWGGHHNPNPDHIFTLLPQLGLDMKKLRSDMNTPRIDKIIKQDREDMSTLGVRKTPSFFVNGKPLQRFGINYLRDLLEKQISLAYP